MVQSGSIKVNDLKFKLPSVTLANYGTAVPGKYGQIKKLQIVFTGRYEAYLKRSTSPFAYGAVYK